MPIRIERDRVGNVIKFHGTSNPQFPNNILTAELNSDDANRVDIYNVVGTTASRKHYEFFALPYTDFRDADNASFASATDVVNYINTAANASAKKNGYHFQNSEFYVAGHAGSADVIEDVFPDTLTTVKVSSATAGQSGSEMPEGLANPYDTSTGLYTLTDFVATDVIQFRFDIDVECFSDESSCEIRLLCTPGNGNPAFTITDQLIAMDAGAGEYSGLSSIPLFVGDTLADGGTPATVLPQIILNGTTADIKPRSFTMFVWR